MATELKEKKRWLFFGLPFTFTTYTVKENVLTVNSGFLKKVESECKGSEGFYPGDVRGSQIKAQDSEHTEYRGRCDRS